MRVIDYHINDARVVQVARFWHAARAEPKF